MLLSQTIMNQFMEDREKKVFTDGLLQVDDQSYHVHKLILKIASPYFVKLFDSPLSQTPELRIKGVTKEIFEIILDFVYGKEADINRGNIEELFFSADMFCVDLLFKRCLVYFESHWREMDDISTVYQLADHFKLEKILHLVLLKFTNEYLSTFPLGKDISEVSYAILRAALENTELRGMIAEEQHLIDIIWEWILHDRENRLQHADELISRLHPEKVAPSALGSRVLLLQDLFKGKDDFQDCKTRIEDAIQKKLTSKKARMAQLRIAFRAIDYGENNVQIVDSLNWAFQRFLINFRIQEILIKNDIVYLFGNKKISTYNFKTQIVSPILEFKNCKYRFGVTVSLGSMYIVGGIEQLKPNQVTSFIYQYDNKFSQWLPRVGHETGTFSLCSPSMVERDGTIYIVGGESKDGLPMNKCYRYSVTNQTFVVYDTTLYVKNPKLAIKGDTLFMFSGEKGANPGLQRLHLHVQNKNPLPLSKVSFRQNCVVLDVMTINEGIVVSFRDDLEPQDVFLCLYHPEEDYLETLGYARGNDTLFKDKIFSNSYKLLLRQY